MGFLGGFRLVYAVCAFSFFFFALLQIPVNLFVSISAGFVFFFSRHFPNCSTVCRYASALLHRFYCLSNPIQ